MFLEVIEDVLLIEEGSRNETHESLKRLFKTKPKGKTINNLDQCGVSQNDDSPCDEYCIEEKHEGSGYICSRTTPLNLLTRKCCECNFCDRKVPPAISECEGSPEDLDQCPNCENMTCDEYCNAKNKPVSHQCHFTTPEIQMTRKCCECDYCGGYDEGLNLVIIFKKLVLKSTLCLLQELDPGGWERS